MWVHSKLRHTCILCSVKLTMYLGKEEPSNTDHTAYGGTTVVETGTSKMYYHILIV